MRATLTDDQQSLREVAADLAASGRPDHPQAWQPIPEADAATRNLMEGFAGLGVPESAGGAGGGLVEVALLLQELGRHVVPTRFVPHVLAVQAALGAGLDVAEGASGASTWTLALDESGVGPDGPWSDAGGVRTRVSHGATADAVVTVLGGDDVAIMTECTTEAEDDTFDIGRPACTVTLDGEVVARGGDAASALRRATVAAAAELVGVGRGAVELGAAYANEREQFGKPIGIFQGVAHQLADALVAVENAWSLVLYAAWAVEEGAADAAEATHLAKASASEAAVLAAERCTQVHGGIGITWEAMPHLYLRRAMTGASTLGTTAHHREQAGRTLVRRLAGAG